MPMAHPCRAAAGLGRWIRQTNRLNSGLDAPTMHSWTWRTSRKPGSVSLEVPRACRDSPGRPGRRQPGHGYARALSHAGADAVSPRSTPRPVAWRRTAGRRPVPRVSSRVPGTAAATCPRCPPPATYPMPAPACVGPMPRPTGSLPSDRWIPTLNPSSSASNPSWRAMESAAADVDRRQAMRR